MDVDQIAPRVRVSALSEFRRNDGSVVRDSSSSGPTMRADIERFFREACARTDAQCARATRRRRAAAVAAKSRYDYDVIGLRAALVEWLPYLSPLHGNV